MATIGIMDDHTLEILGPGVPKPRTLRMHELRDEWPRHSVVCALQCAGNRRHTMRTKMKEVSGIDWFDGAVMNCVWSGPRLADVLESAGVPKKPVDEESHQWHVEFACFQTKCEDEDWYGGSIRLDRAMSEEYEVILATEMNGKPLTAEHGFPIRVVAPGVAGVRCVKWLDRIRVQPFESLNCYQQRDYKILPPNVTDAESAAQHWSETPPIITMPVNSAVGVPATSSKVLCDPTDGCVEVLGYALPAGDDGPVVRVEVSGDEGHNWVQADLLPAPRPEMAKMGAPQDLHLRWAWTLWHARVRIAEGDGRRIWSRATDTQGTVQCGQIGWNFRGLAYNGYGEAEDLHVVVDRPASSELAE